MSSVKQMTISVGQALLLLMEKYSQDLKIFDELKKLYLSGAKDKESLERIEELLKDDLLKKYNVSRDPKVIDSDPTRRYFETHLAFESLKHSIKNLSKQSLEKHYRHLCLAVVNAPWRKPSDKDAIYSVLNGTFDTTQNPVDTSLREYNDCIKRVDTDSIKHFYQQTEKKLKS